MNIQRQRVCIIRQRDYYEIPVRREAEALHRSGFEVDVICLADEGHEKTEIDNGVVIHRLPLTRRKGRLLRYLFDYFSFFLLAAVKVTQLHFRHRYAVIQVNTMPDFLVFATIIPRLFGAKVIVFMKEPTPELAELLYGSPLITNILKLTEQLSLRYAHLAFTVTKQLKETYVMRGANARKIIVVLNGPDTNYFSNFKQVVTLDPTLFTLICHGAIEERYGHDTILKAVNLCRRRIPNLRLCLLGTGSYVDTILQLIDELQLRDCVSYLGWVSMDKVVTELSAADVGIVSQKDTPYSNLVHTNKMYEYIVFGKPTILTRLKSVSHYFDESSMYYVAPDDPQGLADAITDLYLHPDKGRRQLARARELYELYNWDVQSQILLNGYQQVLE